MANSLKACKTTGILEKIPVFMHTATDHAVLNHSVLKPHLKV